MMYCDQECSRNFSQVLQSITHFYSRSIHLSDIQMQSAPHHFSYQAVFVEIFWMHFSSLELEYLDFHIPVDQTRSRTLSLDAPLKFIFTPSLMAFKSVQAQSFYHRF